MYSLLILEKPFMTLELIISLEIIWFYEQGDAETNEGQ